MLRSICPHGEGRSRLKYSWYTQREYIIHPLDVHIYAVMSHDVRSMIGHTCLLLWPGTLGTNTISISDRALISTHDMKAELLGACLSCLGNWVSTADGSGGMSRLPAFALRGERRCGNRCFGVGSQRAECVFSAYQAPKWKLREFVWVGGCVTAPVAWPSPPGR